MGSPQQPRLVGLIHSLAKGKHTSQLATARCVASPQRGTTPVAETSCVGLPVLIGMIDACRWVATPVCLLFVNSLGMGNSPRAATLVRRVVLSFQNRTTPFRRFFPLILFSMLFGFLLANIFGTFLEGLRNVVAWDGFVILSILLFVETTNYFTYHSSNDRSLQRVPTTFAANKEQVCRVVNSFKIGLLLGFFVEAFKVGS